MSWQENIGKYLFKNVEVTIDENKNTYVDNECRDCQQERYIAERSWERYDGEF